MRRQRHGEIVLREGRHRREDEFGTTHRGANVGGWQCNAHIAQAFEVAQADRADREHRLEGVGVAPPEAHLVTGLGQIGGGRITAIAAPQHCDFHDRDTPPSRQML